MGETRKDALRVGFDRVIKLELHGAWVSSDAGLLPFRDLDEAVQLTGSSAAELFDFRPGSNSVCQPGSSRCPKPRRRDRCGRRDSAFDACSKIPERSNRSWLLVRRRDRPTGLRAGVVLAGIS
jgi:hypothetical protein